MCNAVPPTRCGGPGIARLAGQKVSRVAFEPDGEVRVSAAVTLVVPSDSNGNGNMPYPAAARPSGLESLNGQPMTGLP